MTEHHSRVKVTLSMIVDLATDDSPDKIDPRELRGMVEENVVDAIQNAADADLQNAVEVWVDEYEVVESKKMIECSLCGKPCEGKTAHLHQGEYIGDDCCWDPRLKASE